MWGGWQGRDPGDYHLCGVSMTADEFEMQRRTKQDGGRTILSSFLGSKAASGVAGAAAMQCFR